MCVWPPVWGPHEGGDAGDSESPCAGPGGGAWPPGRGGAGGGVCVCRDPWGVGDTASGVGQVQPPPCREPVRGCGPWGVEDGVPHLWVPEKEQMRRLGRDPGSQGADLLGSSSTHSACPLAPQETPPSAPRANSGPTSGEGSQVRAGSRSPSLSSSPEVRASAEGSPPHASHAPGQNLGRTREAGVWRAGARAWGSGSQRSPPPERQAGPRVCGMAPGWVLRGAECGG